MPMCYKPKSDEVVDREEGERQSKGPMCCVLEREAGRRGPESIHEGEGGEGVMNCAQR